ncbi:MAG: RtcB family protein [Atopobiaceae bacterium]|nr:RtcB family protein [Atopobiaceae bacterium]MBR3312671.1 RtcB family protein [Atopobiaceae bacterium]
MTDLKVYAKNLEQAAVDQIETLVSQPAFEDAKVRIMPDAHAGAGCVIGFTANLGDKVVPNLVGVDIGCGMLTARISGIVNYREFDEHVKQAVPSGFDIHTSETCDVSQLGFECYGELQSIDRLNRSLGTLGGGNHFIEVDVAGDSTYLVIHSGSRNLGLQVAQIYQGKAVELCRDDVPKDLKYLEGELADAYLHDMRICQEWAKANRDAIADALVVGRNRNDSFHTVHNYIGDDGVIRKGAISAKRGEKVLIPLNMRDGAVIGYGKGNDDWNNSAPHGAGRVMSRSKARKTLDVGEFKAQMEGVFTTTANEETIDEAPDAYKPAQEIIDALSPTVEISERLMPAYNFKACDGKKYRKGM